MFYFRLIHLCMLRTMWVRQVLGYGYAHVDVNQVEATSADQSESLKVTRNDDRLVKAGAERWWIIFSSFPVIQPLKCSLERVLVVLWVSLNVSIWCSLIRWNSVFRSVRITLIGLKVSEESVVFEAEETLWRDDDEDQGPFYFHSFPERTDWSGSRAFPCIDLWSGDPTCSGADEVGTWQLWLPGFPQHHQRQQLRRGRRTESSGDKISDKKQPIGAHPQTDVALINWWSY